MQQEFGPHRVFNGPIAEDYILGTSDGFSRFSEDIRVVVEGAEFADYFWPAAEQMVEMSHEYWRTNGKFVPNVTVRIASGGYIGGGLYHSQNIEGWLVTLPGIRIVYPSFADDAAGLLRTAMRSRGITLYLEPKFLYNNPMARAAVPEGFAVPFGKARVRRQGADLTIVSYGTTVHFALDAAAELAKEGKEVEVIDLRSLVPLDLEAVAQSVRKTSRVLVAHEDKVHGVSAARSPRRSRKRSSLPGRAHRPVRLDFHARGIQPDPRARGSALDRADPRRGPEGSRVLGRDSALRRRVLGHLGGDPRSKSIDW